MTVVSLTMGVIAGMTVLIVLVFTQQSMTSQGLASEGLPVAKSLSS